MRRRPSPESSISSSPAKPEPAPVRRAEVQPTLLSSNVRRRTPFAPDRVQLRTLDAGQAALTSVPMSQHPEQHATSPARSPYHDRLPIGERVSAAPLIESPFVHFEGDFRMAPLEPMLVPEKPRGGEYDAADCFHCTTGTEKAIWRDDYWHVGHPPTTGLPFIAGLAPNAHVRLDEMDTDLLSTFGDVVQRLAGAIKSLDGVARTHFSRWGDGSAHFHMHFLARPLGMMQGRGAMLAFWDDVLPPLPEDMVASNARAVAAAMAKGGGESMIG